jgi:hypothetical protein
LQFGLPAVLGKDIGLQNLSKWQRRAARVRVILCDEYEYSQHHAPLMGVDVLWMQCNQNTYQITSCDMTFHGNKI